MFSNKPQLGLPKHYSFDRYSIRIPPTEGYRGGGGGGQNYDFSKGVPSKRIKWRLMELIRLPSVHRIFLRASVYEASPGARFARAIAVLSILTAKVTWKRNFKVDLLSFLNVCQ